jgi:hypothetical protein
LAKVGANLAILLNLVARIAHYFTGLVELTTKRRGGDGIASDESLNHKLII